MATPLQDQVAKQLRTVKQALADGLGELKGQWFVSDIDRNNIAALESLRPLIEAWGKRGTDAAAKDTTPSERGWEGWNTAGRDFLKGVQDLTDAADTATLEAVVATLKAVPENIPQDLKNAGKAVGTAAGGLVAGAAEGLGGTLPLGRIALGAGIILGIAGVVYFGIARLAARGVA